MKPKPSIPYYEQAALLARTDQDATLARFKIRMARIEAVEGAAVEEELAKKAAAGPLSVDWFVTRAALELRAGHIGAARVAFAQARAAKSPGLFAACVNDSILRIRRRNIPS